MGEESGGRKWGGELKLKTKTERSKLPITNIEWSLTVQNNRYLEICLLEKWVFKFLHLAFRIEVNQIYAFPPKSEPDNLLKVLQELFPTR